MGASNAMAAFLRWGHLSDRPHRALVYMALVSLDADDDPIYWAGWEPIARIAFRRDVPDAPDIGDDSPKAATARAQRRAAEVSVDHAVRKLRAAGAITTQRAGSYRRTAEHHLNLGLLGLHIEPSATTGSEEEVTAQSAFSAAAHSAFSQLHSECAVQLHTQPSAKEDRGGLRNTGGTTSPQVVNSPAAANGSSRQDRISGVGVNLRALIRETRP